MSSRTSARGGLAATLAFDRLRWAVSEWLPLEPLDPVEYAIGHALFEARSDQRERLTGWLVRHLADRAGTPTRVLSIGCGDGSVDVRVAATLAARGRHVEYVGVEPHGPSGRAFAARVNANSGVRASVLTSPFARARPAGRFDVVLAVHSLYYVDDVGATLRQASGLLAPGGELIILHAPREPLNELVHLLAPGRPQAFSAEVAAELQALGWTPLIERIDNRLDLTETGDPDTDRRLLAFTVQAQLPPALLRLVRGALAERAEAGPGTVLSHPVDVLRVRAPSRSRSAPDEIA